MREDFKRFADGSVLVPRDMNKLSSLGRRFCRMGGGGNLSGRHGDSFVALGAPVPGRQYILEVSNTTATSGVYMARRLGYNHGTGAWVTEDNEWEVDANALGMTLSLTTRVAAFWDSQRGAFIPVAVPPLQKRWGILDSTAYPGLTALVAVYYDSVTHNYDGWDQYSGIVITAHVPPVMQVGSIAVGKWVRAEYFGTKWVLVKAQC